MDNKDLLSKLGYTTDGFLTNNSAFNNIGQQAIGSIPSSTTTDFSTIPGSTTATSNVASSFKPGSSSFLGNMYDKVSNGISSFANGITNMGGSTHLQDYMKGKDASTMTPAELEKAIALGNMDKMNPGVNLGSVANIGLSAFDAYNKYNMQNEQMNLYKQQLADARAERNRKNTARAATTSSLANAKII